MKIVAKTIAIFLFGLAGWYLSDANYNGELTVSKFSSFGWLALAFVAVLVLFFAAKRHNPWTVILAFSLGIISALGAASVWDKIVWADLGLYGGGMLGLFVLWAFLALEKFPRLSPKSVVNRLRSSRQATGTEDAGIDITTARAPRTTARTGS